MMEKTSCCSIAHFAMQQITLYTAVDLIKWMALAVLQHKQKWKTENVTEHGVILNRRTTLTSQDKMRNLYLKDGLLLSHGHECEKSDTEQKTVEL